MVPVMGAAGAAVDYSRAGSARSSMQSALDSTALALSKEAVNLTEAQFTQKANDYFGAVFGDKVAKDVKITPKFTMANGTYTVRVEATAAVDTIVARLLGKDQIDISTFSEVVWGMKRLELALVLDNTTSMASQSRMVELKKATKSLLATLKKAAIKPEDIRVAIVPYGTDVNVGNTATNRSANWLDWGMWEAEPPIMESWLKNSTNQTTWANTGPGSSCPFSNSNHGFGCTNGPASNANNSTISTIPSSGSTAGLICPSVDNGSKSTSATGRLTDVYHNGCYNSVPTVTSSTSNQTVCSGSGSCSCSGYSNCSCTGSGRNKVCTRSVTTTSSGPPYTHTWVANARTTWNGCVRDRAQDYDTSDDSPSAAASTKFQAFQARNCAGSAGLPPIVPLTNDWTVLDSAVNALNTGSGTSGTRYTNITIGLAWGWHALFNNEPLTGAEAPKDDLDKVIILMTDGDNTRNRWYDYNVNNAEIDKRTALACANAKKAGITVYTVRLMDGNEALLSQCAKQLNMYYNVETAVQLNVAFESIAQNLANLRISK